MRKATQANGQKIIFNERAVAAYAESDIPDKTRIYIDGRVFEVLEPLSHFEEDKTYKVPLSPDTPHIIAKTEVKK